MSSKYTTEEQQRFHSRINYTNNPDECWEWTGNKKRKYGSLWIGRKKNSKGKNTLTHRIAWELANGDIPDGMKVLHKCDNPPCCNPKHLFIGTQLDNIKDRDEKGRQVAPKGEENGNCKLSDDQVAEIRRRYQYGSRINGTVALAKEFGASQPQISNIVLNKQRKLTG